MEFQGTSRCFELKKVALRVFQSISMLAMITTLLHIISKSHPHKIYNHMKLNQKKTIWQSEWQDGKRDQSQNYSTMNAAKVCYCYIKFSVHECPILGPIYGQCKPVRILVNIIKGVVVQVYLGSGKFD